MFREIDTVTFPLADEPEFDEIIDVRAPVEFADDHMTGAVNLPVLWDEERKIIGTQYKQESAFEAKKAGASLVSRNIQRHLDDHFSVKPEDYRPLIYCFRGGQRSRSLATILGEIGWPVSVIKGGYKAYRRHVIDILETRPAELRYEIINGLTGTGKTLILRELDRIGAQVLDLEGLANHKGSVFGEDPDSPQPSQKRFESLIHDELTRFDPAGPVYVEAESPKIGRLSLPVPLRKALGQAPVIEIVSPLEARVEFLLGDYQEWLAEPERVLETIDRLKPFHSRESIAEWKAWCLAGAWEKFIGGLLTDHYDHHYCVGGQGNYRKPDIRHPLLKLDPSNFEECARALLDGEITRRRRLEQAG